MVRHFLGVLSAAVLAGVLLGGCRSAPPEKPPEQEPPGRSEQKAESTTTPLAPKPEPPFGPNLEPLHSVTREPLPTTFYFEYDQARLAQADIRVLALHAQILRDYRNRSVQIEGHCDERGTREYNLALGERRSEAVRRYLISAGVRSTQVETVSFGEERPVDPGHAESAWAKNRRAVVIYR